MPQNVLFFNDIVLDVVNFQVIDKEELYTYVVGKEDVPDEEEISTGSNGEKGILSSFKDTNIVMNSLLVLFLLLILALLIGLVIFCKVKLVPKCPGFV